MVSGEDSSTTNILSYFPGTPREQQTQILTTIEANWDKFDVFVVRAPVATGKSRIAIALQRWNKSGAILTPTNILQQQYLDEFPKQPTLWRRGLYKCIEHDTFSCADTKYELDKVCKHCPYIKATRKAHSASVGVFNYYTYLAHGLYKPMVVLDEAHQLIPMLQELAAKKLWHREYKYPHNLRSLGDIIRWLDSLEQPLVDPKLMKLRADVLSMNPSTMVQRGQDMYRGSMQDVLKLIPLDTRNEPPVMWPAPQVRKIVLMSATLGKKDVESMGLSQRRTLYLDCSSPIPPEQRPVIAMSVANMGAATQQEAIPLVVERLMALIEHHKGQKGLIHCPYSVAEKLRPLLKHDRLMWHTRDDKQEMYQRFRDMPPDSGAVLVASGLYEGIDLPYDAGRWQAICKVPYMSLGEPAVVARMKQDGDWYAWEALKTLLQATGRICRTPTDFGVSYILDTNFKRLYGQSKRAEMVPGWFDDALIWE